MHQKKILDFLLIIMFVATNSIFSQNVSKLNELNGFREIHFRNSIRSYNFFEERNNSNTNYMIINKIGESVERTAYRNWAIRPPFYCNNCKDYILKSAIPNFLKINGCNILKLGVSTYKDSIYEISFVVESFALSRSLIESHISAFGEPNGNLGYGWDIEDFRRYEMEDKGLYMAWYSDKISLSIISGSAESQFRGSKRCAYTIQYSLLELKKKADSEDRKNTPIVDPLKEFR